MHAPGMRARYVTCEAFTNEFIAAIKDKRMDAFKRRYREEFDVLLIDDIQFLAGKEGIQEEFFHTFNTLHASGRQLVLSSDRAPREISDLADRLRSRFEWGLLVDVQPPDIETRIAILHKRVAADRVRIDDPELLPAIARRVPTNIRELEGALTRVLAYASLTGRPASAALVRETLRDLPDADAPVSVATIKQVVSEAFGIPVPELESAKRSQASWRRGSSRCTSAASSRTRRCPQSGASSAVATTRPCSTRCRRSRAGCTTIAASTTRSTT